LKRSSGLEEDPGLEEVPELKRGPRTGILSKNGNTSARCRLKQGWARYKSTAQGSPLKVHRSRFTAQGGKNKIWNIFQ
jgi:hypothetical protein